MSVWADRDDGTRTAIDYVLLTIGKESGTEGWPHTYSPGSGWYPYPVSKGEPTSVVVKPSPLPLAGEPFDLTIRYYSTQDVVNANVGIVVLKANEGVGTTRVPLEQVLASGKLTWSGELKQNGFVELSGALNLTEGDWKIYAYCYSGDNKPFYGERHSFVVHIGKTESYYGWAEKHSNISASVDSRKTDSLITNNNQTLDESGEITINGTVTYQSRGGNAAGAAFLLVYLVHDNLGITIASTYSFGDVVF